MKMRLFWAYLKPSNIFVPKPSSYELIYTATNCDSIHKLAGITTFGMPMIKSIGLIADVNITIKGGEP